VLDQPLPRPKPGFQIDADISPKPQNSDCIIRRGHFCEGKLRAHEGAMDEIKKIRYLKDNPEVHPRGVVKVKRSRLRLDSSGTYRLQYIRSGCTIE
jgi:hypothetical protein